MARFRSSASFGKRQEFGAIAELLRRGYDVYVTLVDDQQIDCVVRQGPNEFYDVQIKARSRDCVVKNQAYFPLLWIDKPRRNYIFILYAEAIGDRGTYWVIPSTTLVAPGFGNSLKSGANKGAFRVRLASNGRPRPKYLEYINAFENAFGDPPIVDISSN
jgi:hypothetical protein